MMLIIIFVLHSILHQHVIVLRIKEYRNTSEYRVFQKSPLQSKSLILYLNWNQRENLNRGVEKYLFKVNL